MAYERITVDPAQMGGLPCVRGMRVTVSAVLGQLAAGQSIEDVLADFPYLERYARCRSARRPDPSSSSPVPDAAEIAGTDEDGRRSTRGRR